MAIDESLVANFTTMPIFRLYTWRENSFTIGRFQKIEDIDHIERFGDNFSKRLTGGGLLLHGFDLSYTIIMPIDLLGKRSVKESYEYLCSFLINFYKKLGLDAAYAKDSMDISLSKSFFCQEGFEDYDIVISGKKIGGNAQKRTKELIHQHGSIPLRHDNREFAGYSLEEFGITLGESEAKALLKESFIETFEATLRDKNYDASRI